MTTTMDAPTTNSSTNGSLKTPCPNDCGAQITRRGLTLHLQKCPKRTPDVAPEDALRLRVEREIADAQAMIDSCLDSASDGDSHISDAKSALQRRRNYQALLDAKT